MRLAMVLGLVALVVTPAQVSADRRDSGAQDTARHAEPYDYRDQRGAGRGGRETVVVVPRADPAVENFWSDRCVNQRRFGTIHSKDCDNPAYTGGGYPSYVAPYPRHAPYDTYGYGTYVPGRGGIGVDRGGYWGSKTYGDWEESRGRLRLRPNIPR